MEARRMLWDKEMRKRKIVLLISKVAAFINMLSNPNVSFEVVATHGCQ
jgi:hypothetical protein